MKLRSLLIVLFAAGLLSAWIATQGEPGKDFALTEELKAPATDPDSLAYALSKVASPKAEELRETQVAQADSLGHAHLQPVAPTSSTEQAQPRQRERYRILREGVEQREGRGRAIAILEAPEHNYPMLRRERFTGPMGQTVERWMVADHVLAVLKQAASEDDLKDLLNQNRLSVRGTGATNRSYLIQFDGTDPLRLPQVIELLEASGLFDAVESDAVELAD